MDFEYFFTLASGLLFLSVFVATNARLPLCAWVLLDASLCVTSETTASVGWSNGVKVTVLRSFASRFSKAPVSQVL